MASRGSGPGIGSCDLRGRSLKLIGMADQSHAAVLAKMLAPAAMIRMATSAWSSVRVGRRWCAWRPRAWPVMRPAAMAGSSVIGAVGDDAANGGEVASEEDEREGVS